MHLFLHIEYRRYNMELLICIATLIHGQVLENHDTSAELLGRYPDFNIIPNLLPEFGGLTDKVELINLLLRTHQFSLTPHSSFTYSLTHSLTHSLIHSLTLTNLLTQLFTQLITHSFTHFPLAHSLCYPANIG